MKNKMFIKKIIIFTLSILFIFTPLSSFANTKNKPLPSNNDNLIKYTNNYFNKLVKSGQIPGATFILIKDGKVVFKKGYGYANVETKLPVDPDKTVFRAASISKLFTGTAVMQLKEKNKLDINADINTYLKGMKISNSYNKPITIANLMTHTAGFDESYYNGGPSYADDMNSRFVKSVTTYIPKLVRAPSLVPCYSNYGVTLEGYIVSLVSGETFTDYIDKNILNPLNMKNSSFNLPKNILTNMAEGYSLSGNKFNKIDFYGEPALPAGGLNTTAADMGNFILSQLQNGKYNNNQILSKESIDEMHSEHYKSGKYVGGICYAFMEDYVFGHRVLEHTGSLPGFTSHLMLLPESNTGYFLSINEDANANDVSSILSDFQKGLVNTLLPSSSKKVMPSYPISQKQLDNYTGIYKGTRTPHTTLYKIDALISGSFELKVKSGDKKLLVYNGGTEKPFVCVAPNEFRSEEDNGYISFLPDSKGKTNYMMVSRVNSMERINWYEQSIVQLSLLVVLLVVFLLQVIISIKTILANSGRKLKNNKTNILALIISLINLSFFIGLLLYFLTLPPSFLFESFATEIIVHSIFVKVWLLLPFISIGLIFVLMFMFIKENQDLGLIKKIWYITFTVCSFCYIIFLNYWCILGYKLY